MADEADIANEDLERTLTAALEKRIQYSGESALHCEECGDKIPARRRKILPGVTTCADCQTVREREARLYGERE
jgi:phage/conjugal plasmid C-4 type zinc finger TraR family protein